MRLNAVSAAFMAFCPHTLGTDAQVPVETVNDEHGLGRREAHKPEMA
jgi:hypothetical protein